MEKIQKNIKFKNLIMKKILIVLMAVLFFGGTFAQNLDNDMFSLSKIKVIVNLNLILFKKYQ